MTTIDDSKNNSVEFKMPSITVNGDQVKDQTYKRVYPDRKPSKQLETCTGIVHIVDKKKYFINN